MVPLLLAAAALLAQTANAHILCQREGEIEAVNPSPLQDGDSCTGSVVLQGISYQCGRREEIDSKRSEYLKDLTEKGRAFCEDYCGKRGGFFTKCVGHFSPPQQCGFTVPANLAEAYGRDKASCDPSCEGVAFAYCSIYRGSLLQATPEFLKDVVPNCLCKPTSRF